MVRKTMLIVDDYKDEPLAMDASSSRQKTQGR